MKNMVFICTADDCGYDGDQPYLVNIPSEVYERNNIATLFCPYCGSGLEDGVEALGEKTA
jgi:hypothetical protein